MVPELRTLSQIAACLLAAAACGGVGDLSTPGASSVLVSPEDHGVFRQNDASIGCPADAARGYGFRAAFDWKDVKGASAYNVVYQQRDARYPAIVNTVAESHYEATFCNAFVIDRNLAHWLWKVEALGPGVNAPVILSTEEREFRFEPCRLANGNACWAPPR